MIITKSFYSLIELNKYIEDNGIKSKDIYYMGNFLNIEGYCLIHTPFTPIPNFTLQYDDGVYYSTVSCTNIPEKSKKWAE